MSYSHELTAEARIRRAALRLFAEGGYEPTTVRAIAEAAGVSPGLILHHYGSKEGLRDAVNEEVVRVVLELIDDVLDSSKPVEDQFEAGGAEFRTLLTERPELGAYIRRLFFDGEEAGVRILQRFMEVGRQYTIAMEERGVLRRVSDPEMRDLQGLILDLSPVLFGPLFAAYFGVPPLDEDLFQRWLSAEFDLLSHGMLAQPASSDTSVTDLPATEDRDDSPNEGNIS